MLDNELHNPSNIRGPKCFRIWHSEELKIFASVKLTCQGDVTDQKMFLSSEKGKKMLSRFAVNTLKYKNCMLTYEVK